MLDDAADNPEFHIPDQSRTPTALAIVRIIPARPVRRQPNKLARATRRSSDRNEHQRPDPSPNSPQDTVVTPPIIQYRTKTHIYTHTHTTLTAPEQRIPAFLIALLDRRRFTHSSHSQTSKQPTRELFVAVVIVRKFFSFKKISDQPGLVGVLGVSSELWILGAPLVESLRHTGTTTTRCESILSSLRGTTNDFGRNYPIVIDCFKCLVALVLHCIVFSC